MVLNTHWISTDCQADCLGVLPVQHGDNACDAGASHGQQHIDNEPKKGRAPPKCAVEVIPLLGQIDKHSAELIEGEKSLPYIKVETMDEMRSHYFFKFQQGKVIVMYKLGSDVHPSLAYEVTE